MLKKGELLALSYIIALFFTSSPASAVNTVFHNYAVGFDSGYTLHSLIFGGLGGGIEAELLVSGVFSFTADFGYENFKAADNGTTNNTQLIYASCGGRMYMTFDAIRGPFAGLLLGIRADIVNGINYNHFIMPLEIGWKFVIGDTGYFYFEPLGKLVIMPYYDSVNISIQNNYAFFMGINIGAAF